MGYIIEIIKFVLPNPIIYKKFMENMNIYQ